MDIRRQRGCAGETVAAAYLEQKGIRILVQNFRCRFGEIDIIAKEKDVFIIVEVKTRTDKKQGYPCEAVDKKKQRKICRTFDYFRMRYHLDDYVPIRFDVIEVDRDSHCHWIPNAFEYQG